MEAGIGSFSSESEKSKVVMRFASHRNSTEFHSQQSVLGSHDIAS